MQLWENKFGWRAWKKPTGQIVRWLQFLETCSLKVTHCPAYEHKIAVLSRNPCKPGMKQEEKYHRWKNAFFWRCQSFKEIIWHCLVQIRLQQLSDPDIPFSIKTRKKWQPNLKKSIQSIFQLKTLWTHCNCLHLIVGVLHRTLEKDYSTYSLSSYETLPFEVLTWPSFNHQHT